MADFEPLPDDIKGLVGNHPVWGQFNIIRQIPRESGNESGIASYIVGMANDKGLFCNVDKAGNILVRKKGSKSSGVCIQSHLDMVCVKKECSIHDFTKDPIKLRLEDDKLFAVDTTLGADNGFGIALMLSLMDAQSRHPDLELLFTVEEETGMKGVQNLGHNLKSKYIINLDSEEVDELIIGCAGGVRLNADYEFKRLDLGKKVSFFCLEISGLPGGHSGNEILDKQGKHAVTIGMDILNDVRNKVMNSSGEFYLVSINSGEKSNVIPSSFKSIFAFSGGFDINSLNLEKGYGSKNIFSVEPLKAIDNISTEIVFSVLNKLKSGVIKMSDSMDKTVETSTNLGVVKTYESKLSIAVLTRSSDNAWLEAYKPETISFLKDKSFSDIKSSSYPGWLPNPDSHLVKVAEEAARELGMSMETKAIHAGLEAGFIVSKFPGMQAISIGPTIKHPHSTDEYVVVSTVDQSWKHLLKILENL